MSQEFNAAKDVHIIRDNKGVVRELLHFDKPFVSKAQTPKLIAEDYLKKYADVIEIKVEKLKNLNLPPSQTITNDPEEFRFFEEKQILDNGAVVSFYQTLFGLPVREAGITVNINPQTSKVLSSQSTLHPDLTAQKPSNAALKRLLSIDKEKLAQILGLTSQAKLARIGLEKLEIESHRLIIYRYENANRLPANGQKQLGETHATNRLSAPEHPTLPLPPVPDAIKEGEHYVCAEINFSLPYLNLTNLHWVAIVEAETETVLFLRAFVDDINGLVFPIEPMTSNGGPLPSASNAALNAVRVSVPLNGLVAPVSNVQSLTGNFVIVKDVEPPTVAPPTQTAGNDFNYDARTNDFAAVNAYYHSDKFFRMMQDDLGFNIASYFGGTTFPTPVDHRGRYGTTDGIEINAHCAGTTGGGGIAYTGFCLADLGDTTNPIGIACDFRVVLHELAGHGVLYNHVNSPNFGFSHSAGDSVAVILNDPGSQAPDRFVSFPWLGMRRHDRAVSSGWGWGGSNDDKGYGSEQILSTTLFRAYRSIGGDSGDLGAQQFASKYMVYLILRAIGSLTPVSNPSNASGFATALMTADLSDWTYTGQAGGAYGKVIRWAFEKQGLYSGAPPAVDVYIDDGRTGEYQYQSNFWDNQSIWNRNSPDGGNTHQDPIVNQTNYAYVKVKNRGTQTANNVIVLGYHALPAMGLSFPNDWQLMTTPAIAAGNIAPNSSVEVTVGPFEWTPTEVGHECIFMVASCSGDPSNTSNIAAGDSIPEWRLVPNDNNIGQRNVSPVPGGGGLKALVLAFEKMPILLKNPGRTRAQMVVKATLPAFLLERGWRLDFINAGGSKFSLGPGETAKIYLRLTPGKEFQTQDVVNTRDRTIHVFGYADGILLGGMSYELDPNLKEPTPTISENKECKEVAKELLDCLNLKTTKIKKVRIRKVTLDIEFDDPDCKEDC